MLNCVLNSTLTSMFSVFDYVAREKLLFKAGKVHRNVFQGETSLDNQSCEFGNFRKFPAANFLIFIPIFPEIC